MNIKNLRRKLYTLPEDFEVDALVDENQNVYLTVYSLTPPYQDLIFLLSDSDMDALKIDEQC
jgi:hypothetical protein